MGTNATSMPSASKSTRRSATLVADSVVTAMRPPRSSAHGRRWKSVTLCTGPSVAIEKSGSATRRSRWRTNSALETRVRSRSPASSRAFRSVGTPRWKRAPGQGSRPQWSGATLV